MEDGRGSPDPAASPASAAPGPSPGSAPTSPVEEGDAAPLEEPQSPPLEEKPSPTDSPKPKKKSRSELRAEKIQEQMREWARIAESSLGAQQQPATEGKAASLSTAPTSVVAAAVAGVSQSRNAPAVEVSAVDILNPALSEAGKPYLEAGAESSDVLTATLKDLVGGKDADPAWLNPSEHSKLPKRMRLPHNMVTILDPVDEQGRARIIPSFREIQAIPGLCSS